MRRAILILLAVLVAATGCSSQETAMLEQADSYILKADYQKAKTIYETILSKNKKSADAYLALADLYEKEKNYDKAADVLKEGISSVKKPEELKKSLAYLYYFNEKYSQSEREWKGILDSSLYADAYQGLADVYEMQDETGKLFNLAEEAMEAYPKDARMYALAANIYGENEEMEEAADALAKGLEADVNNQELYDSIDRLHSRGWEDIEEEGEDLLQEDKKSKAGMIFVFYGRFFEEDYEAALEAIRPLGNKIKNNHVRIMAAIAFHMSGNEKQAEKIISAKNIKKISDLSTLYELVYFYETIGEENKAIAMSEKIAGTHDHAHRLYWWLYKKTNDEAYLKDAGLIRWKAETEEEDNLVISLVNKSQLYVGTRWTAGDYWSEDFEVETKFYEIKNGKVDWSYSKDEFAGEKLSQNPKGQLYYHYLIDESVYTPLVALDGTKKVWQNDNVITNTAFAKDGTIYVGVLKDSGEGFLQALNEQGKVKWEAPVNIPQDPVVGKNGTIYVSTYYHDMEGAGTMTDGGIYAFNPDGTVKWKHEEEGIYSTPIIGPDGVVYTINTHYEQDTSTIYGFSPDGKIVMEYETSSTGGDPIVTDNSIITTANQTIEAVSHKGKKAWEVSTADYPTIYPKGDGSILYVTNDGPNSIPQLTFVNKEGEELWTSAFYSPDDPFGYEEIETDTYTYVQSLVTSENGIFAITNEDEEMTFWSFANDGQLRWAQNFGMATGDLVVRNGEVILTAGNKVYGLDEEFLVTHDIFMPENPFKTLADEEVID
ncbi:tetratricopeptide (TPR) repeat protein [Bacillus fengqiuensis]|nr:tetratricopeptide (TPR) repeat protein [Bacillus fengqiuensis]